MRIYLDHNATSPLRPEARKAVEVALDAGNPSSIHREGQASRAMVEAARAELANALGVNAPDLNFTSGATEAINQAIHTSVQCGRARIIAPATEHDAVHAAISAHGGTAEICPVNADGTIDLGALEQRLRPSGETALVALQAANNETGVIQPFGEAISLAHRAGALVLVDAVQMFGKLPVDADAIDADFVAISAHKLGGPMGMGGLFVRPGQETFALIAGGGQEQRRRGGTENVAGIAGFGAAATAAVTGIDGKARHIEALRDQLEANVRAIAPDVVIFGRGAPRLPNTCAFAIPGRAAATMLIAFDLNGIAVSSGSACSSGNVAASHVLSAMGVAPELASGAIRVSLGWSTTKDDIETFGRNLADILGNIPAAHAAA